MVENTGIDPVGSHIEPKGSMSSSQGFHQCPVKKRLNNGQNGSQTLVTTKYLVILAILGTDLYYASSEYTCINQCFFCI